MSPERSNMEAIVILEEQQRSEGASVAEGVWEEVSVYFILAVSFSWHRIFLNAYLVGKGSLLKKSASMDLHLCMAFIMCSFVDLSVFLQVTHIDWCLLGVKAWECRELGDIVLVGTTVLITFPFPSLWKHASLWYGYI